MPKKSGIEVLQHICETGMRDTLPVIMITGDSASESAVEAYAYGAADFIHKPFDTKIIMHRAENIMELYSRRRDIEKELDDRTKALRESRAKLKKTNEFLISSEWLVSIDQSVSTSDMGNSHKCCQMSF